MSIISQATYMDEDTSDRRNHILDYCEEQAKNNNPNFNICRILYHFPIDDYHKIIIEYEEDNFINAQKYRDNLSELLKKYQLTQHIEVTISESSVYEKIINDLNICKSESDDEA